MDFFYFYFFFLKFEKKKKNCICKSAQHEYSDRVNLNV